MVLSAVEVASERSWSMLMPTATLADRAVDDNAAIARTRSNSVPIFFCCFRCFSLFKDLLKNDR